MANRYIELIDMQLEAADKNLVASLAENSNIDFFDALSEWERVLIKKVNILANEILEACKAFSIEESYTCYREYIMARKHIMQLKSQSFNIEKKTYEILNQGIETDEYQKFRQKADELLKSAQKLNKQDIKRLKERMEMIEFWKNNKSAL